MILRIPHTQSERGNASCSAHAPESHVKRPGHPGRQLLLTAVWSSAGPRMGAPSVVPPIWRPWGSWTAYVVAGKRPDGTGKKLPALLTRPRQPHSCQLSWSSGQRACPYSRGGDRAHPPESGGSKKAGHILQALMLFEFVQARTSFLIKKEDICASIFSAVWALESKDPSSVIY